MFLVKDITRPEGCITGSAVLNDVKDVGDVVIGITGSKVAGEDAIKYAGNMRFNDKIERGVES